MVILDKIKNILYIYLLIINKDYYNKTHRKRKIMDSLFRVFTQLPSIKQGLEAFSEISVWGTTYEIGKEFYRRVQELDEQNLLWKPGDLLNIFLKEAGHQCHNDSTSKFSLVFSSSSYIEIFRDDFGHEVTLRWYFPYEKQEHYFSEIIIGESTQDNLSKKAKLISGSALWGTTVRIGENVEDYRSWKAIFSKDDPQEIINLSSSISRNNFNKGFIIIKKAFIDSKEGEEIIKKIIS